MARGVPEFWQTFGGTIFGTLAVGVMLLFNGLHANLAELHREVAQLQESRAGYATAGDIEAAMYDADARLAAVEDALGSFAEYAYDTSEL